MKEPLFLSTWRWLPILDYTRNTFAQFDLDPYPIPLEFIEKESSLGNKSKGVKVNLFTLAFKTNKIRQARAVCLDAGNNISVLNFVVSPFHNFDLPFFGADFVTLPTGHLIAIDLQPALKSNLKHTKKVWERLKPIHARWNDLIPSGGPIPAEAKPYFSEGLLWTRIPLGLNGDELISNVITQAYKEYLSLYIELLDQSFMVDNKFSLQLLNGQKEYMHYRANKDPARGMLIRFFGKEWTESYISKVLFNL